jgi:hypothetical protein
MTTQWINEESYTTDENGTSASHTMRGKVLESKAGPHTLDQKDFQGDVIVHDIMTQGGLNETEVSNHSTTYAANVNSTLTECAPNISKSYKQNQSYSESYQNKTETIKADTFKRTITTPQFTQSQNQLNLSVPNSISLNASERITRSINIRNATIDTHTMTGKNYSLRANTIQRFGGVTIIRGNSVRLCTNNLHLNAGPSEPPPQAVKPRQDPPNMIAKVSGSFGSRTVSLPPAYSNNYMIHIDFTVSGEYEMESLNSVNPTTISKEGIQADVNKTIGDYFFGMEVKSSSDLDNGMNTNTSPSFVIGNKYGDYTLEDGVSVASLYTIAGQVFIFNYVTSISKEKKIVNEWLLTLTGSLTSTITIGKRSVVDNLEIAVNDMVQNVSIELKKASSNPYYGPILRGLNIYARPTIQAMYKEAEFIDTAVITALELLGV